MGYRTSIIIYSPVGSDIDYYSYMVIKLDISIKRWEKYGSEKNRKVAL